MDVSVAYSPCPNDSVTFLGWENGIIKSPIIPKVSLGDIQSLNEWAFKGLFSVSKVSFASLGYLLDDYVLLPCAAAIGFGCGPKIISKNPIDKESLKDCTVAIPGENTTAHLLLSGLFPSVTRKVFCTYDEVLTLLEKGEVDAGLIIHETRFTFQKLGFYEVADLGSLWEEKTKLPIPLGGVIAKRSLGNDILQQISSAISSSISYGLANTDILWDTILERSIEKDQSIVHQHIDLYVNKESLSLSSESKSAIVSLLDVGAKLGFYQSRLPEDIFFQGTQCLV
jgi:1,4-dihydroxy-6-naphthoate synthase